MDEELQPTQEAENFEESETLNEDVQTNEDIADDGDGDVEKQEEQPDEYEIELETLQAKIAKKDEIIAHKNRAIESLKRRPNSDTVLKEIEEIKAKAQSEINQMKQVVLSDIVSDEIAKVASTEGERKLIEFHFNNSIKLSGYNREAIRDAVRTAKLKANEKKILSKMEEMAFALKAQATTSTHKDSSSVNVSQPEKQKYNSKEKKLLKAFGIDA